MRFPKVSGSNLLRERIELPGGFEGDLNLLFIPFQQWQQSDVDTWIPFVRELEASYPALKYYELPTIRKMNWFAKRFINEGMRAGIPNHQTRQRTITLYIDKDSFRKALSINDEKDVTILLVDSNGSVLWRTIGRFSQEKGFELDCFIQEQASVKMQFNENRIVS